VRLHEPDGYECRFAALMAVPSARRDRRRVRGVRRPDCTSREAARTPLLLGGQLRRALLQPTRAASIA